MWQKILVLDEKLAEIFFNFNVAHPVFYKIVGLVSVWLIWAVPLFLVWFWFKKDAQTALLGFLAGVIGWQIIAKAIGYFWFRARPFTLLPQQEFLFARPTYSFPSDHAVFCFALAFYFLLVGYKKEGKWLLVLAVMVSLTRVLANLHYLSDIVAGGVLGFLLAIIFWKLQANLEKYLANPIISVAKKLRLK